MFPKMFMLIEVKNDPKHHVTAHRATLTGHTEEGLFLKAQQWIADLETEPVLVEAATIHEFGSEAGTLPIIKTKKLQAWLDEGNFEKLAEAQAIKELPDIYEEALSLSVELRDKLLLLMQAEEQTNSVSWAVRAAGCAQSFKELEDLHSFLHASLSRAKQVRNNLEQEGQSAE